MTRGKKTKLLFPEPIDAAAYSLWADAPLAFSPTEPAPGITVAGLMRFLEKYPPHWEIPRKLVSPMELARSVVDHNQPPKRAAKKPKK